MYFDIYMANLLKRIKSSWWTSTETEETIKLLSDKQKQIEPAKNTEKIKPTFEQAQHSFRIQQRKQKRAFYQGHAWEYCQTQQDKKENQWFLLQEEREQEELRAKKLLEAQWELRDFHIRQKSRGNSS